MNCRHRILPGREVIIVNAEGLLDLEASRGALKKIASDPDYKTCFELLMDLREVTCNLSATDIFELASFMANPEPRVPTGRKIALLVSGEQEFDHAKFLELCARNRGLSIAVFTDPEEAVKWLDVEFRENGGEG